MIKKLWEKTSRIFSKNQPVSFQEFITSSNINEPDTVAKMSLNLKKKYKKAIATHDVAKFHQEAINLVMHHFEQSEFVKHKPLMREIKFFLHYTFMILQDDYFLGDQIFSKKMTRLDDYIFSQYRKNTDLAFNIRKLTTLAYSNRFEKDPKNNFLSYFVFIEENGIELIELLQDFYKMLETTQKSNSWFYFNKRARRIHKSYQKDTNRTQNTEEGKTLWTVQPSFIEDSKQVQIKIYRDELKAKEYKK